MTGGKQPETSGHENPAFYQGLGRAIKVARTRLGLERKDLAERADLSYAYLSDIETGRGRPSSSALLAIANALGMDASSLLSDAEGFMKPRPEVRSRYFRSDDLSTRTELAPRRPGREEPVPPAGPAFQMDQPGLSALKQVDEIEAGLRQLSPSDLAMVLDLVRRLSGN